MFEWFTKLTILFAVAGGVYAFYKTFIKPRRLKTKLQKLADMITDWYDEIDCNLDAGLNMAVMNNRENKIKDYIERNLKTYYIKPTQSIIREWNKKVGLKEEYWNDLKSFQKYSRISPKGLSMVMFFQMLVTNFWTFHGQYTSEGSNCNFAEVEMPVKFLKFYMEALGYTRD